MNIAEHYHGACAMGIIFGFLLLNIIEFMGGVGLFGLVIGALTYFIMAGAFYFKINWIEQRTPWEK